MRKKLMLVATLVGVLSLGACVDDKESASVEAIRDAKAEQLKSLAAMNNAEAEATKILAEAEAALVKAQTEALQLENDHEKAIAAKKLEEAILELEARLLEKQAELLQAQLDLKNAQSDLDAAERERLNRLANAYSSAVATLNSAKVTLSSQKNQLLLLENGLTSAQEVKEKTIARLTKENAGYQAQIDVYTAYTGMTTAQKEEKLAELALAIDKCKNERYAATTVKDQAEASIRKYDDYGDLMAGTYYDLTYSKYYETASQYTSFYDGYLVYPVKDFYKVTQETIEYTYADNGFVNTRSYNVLAYCSIDEELFEVMLADANAYLYSAQEALKAANETAKSLKKISDKAYEEWIKASQDPDVDNINDYYYAYVQAKSAYDNYCESTLVSAQQYLDSRKEKVAIIKADWAFLADAESVKIYKALVDAYNASEKIYAEAYVSYFKALHNSWVVEAEYNAVENIWSVIDVEWEISRLKSDIESNNVAIINANSTFASKESSIESLEAQIEAQEAKVIVAQANVAQTKAALDAALAE